LLQGLSILRLLVSSLRSFPIHSIREVVAGKTTKALASNADAKEDSSFALVSADFTLELEAASPEAAKEWISEINRLRDSAENKKVRMAYEGTNINR
jgi:hypothetical protein